MADKFAEFVVVHNEAFFRELVFPKLTGVVKKNPGDQQVRIQLRIDRCDLLRYAHHLRGVLDEPATTSMMVFARCRGATKTFAPFI